MTEVSKVVIRYQLLRDEVTREFYYALEGYDQDASGERTLSRVEGNTTFAKLLGVACELLRKNLGATLLLERSDKPDMLGTHYDAEFCDILRKDPASVVRIFIPQTTQAYPFPTLHAGYETLVHAFGERIYLPVNHGALVDPCTNKQTTLAYGAEIGWRIRGVPNTCALWLPVTLQGIHTPDHLPEETELALLLSGLRCVSISTEDLCNSSLELSKEVDKLFLNLCLGTEGVGISRVKLREKLEAFRKETRVLCQV